MSKHYKTNLKIEFHTKTLQSKIKLYKLAPDLVNLNQMLERLMTPEEVAEALQLHHLTVLKFIKSKALKSIKLGRIYRVTESDLQSFLENNRQ